MGFIKALVVLLAVPALGLITSGLLLSEYPPALAGAASVLGSVSFASALLGAGLLLAFTLASGWAGTDRVRITRLFPVLVAVTLVVLIALVLSHTAILIFAAWLLLGPGSAAQWLVIGAIAFGGAWGVGGLIRSLFGAYRAADFAVIGELLTPHRQPLLHKFVTDIAGQLGARPPDHIVVGLTPNFFVTSAPVRLAGTNEVLDGETLYLSLPLARILTREEVRAVVGHELGHFRGKDTWYSQRFAPVYAGLSHAVRAMGAGGDLLNLARLPTRALLRYMIEAFHRNVSAIGREREYEADRAAIDVATPQALATSLLKIGLYANAWGSLEQRVVERLRVRKGVVNLSSLFASIVHYDVDERRLPGAVAAVAGQHIAHPTDSHPTTASRIAEAGVDIADISYARLRPGADAGIDLVADAKRIEEALTVRQLRYYVSKGVKVPDNPPADADQSGTLLAALGAHMVLADGVVVAAEIDHAEQVGRSLSAAFDVIEFREFCHYPDTIPELDHLLDAARDVSSEAKAAVFDYMRRIAGADLETSPQERALLRRVGAAFGFVSPQR